MSLGIALFLPVECDAIAFVVMLQSILGLNCCSRGHTLGHYKLRCIVVSLDCLLVMDVMPVEILVYTICDDSIDR